MIVRAARQDDAGAVCEIMNRVITQTTITFTTVERTQAQVAADIAGAMPFLVCAQDGTVCGYARLFPFRGGPGYAHVAEYAIALTPAAQGRWAGRMLFAALCIAAQDCGIAQIIGGVSSGNVAALGFHRHMGFTKVGCVPGAGRKWGQELDLILMQKRL